MVIPRLTPFCVGRLVILLSLVAILVKYPSCKSQLFISVAVNLRVDLNASFTRFAKVLMPTLNAEHSILARTSGVTIHSLVLYISVKADGFSIILDKISATYKKHLDSLGLSATSPSGISVPSVGSIPMANLSINDFA